MRIFGALSAVIHRSPAGERSSRTRASVSSPLSPTSTMRGQREARGELLGLGGHGAGIGRVATEDLGGHRTAVPVAEQGEDDLQLAAPAVAGVAALGQRALRALEVHRGQVAEHERAVLDVLRRQGPLDALLPPEQPVHRLVEFLRRRVRRAGLLAQRVGQGLGAEAAGGGELRARVEDARRDHRQRQRPHPRRTAVQQSLEAQRAGRAQHGGGVSVGAGAQDLESVAEGLQGDAALEQDAQPVHDVVGQLRQVGQGALPDLAALAEGLAQEHGGRGFPIGHAFDIHDYDRNDYHVSCQWYSLVITWVHISHTRTGVKSRAHNRLRPGISPIRARTSD